MWPFCDVKNQKIIEDLKLENKHLQTLLEGAQKAHIQVEIQLRSLNQLLDINESLFKRMHLFGQSLVNTHNSMIMQSIKNTSLGECYFIELAKFDHLIFKFDIYKVFMGLTSKHSTHAACVMDHTECRLGMWYYGDRSQQFHSNSIAFQSMELPHIRVHKFGNDALNHFNSGEYANGILSLEKMEMASDLLLKKLEELGDDCMKIL